MFATYVEKLMNGQLNVINCRFANYNNTNNIISHTSYIAIDYLNLD